MSVSHKSFSADGKLDCPDQTILPVVIFPGRFPCRLVRLIDQKTNLVFRMPRFKLEAIPNDQNLTQLDMRNFSRNTAPFFFLSILFTLVGSAFIDGRGTKGNFEEGIKWFLKVAVPSSTTSISYMGEAQLGLSEADADPEYPRRDLVEAYKWLNLAMGDFPNEDVRLDFDEKRYSIASSMTREQIEEAQRGSAELFLPKSKIIERIKSGASTTTHLKKN